jgi:hypothetical protein
MMNVMGGIKKVATGRVTRYSIKNWNPCTQANTSIQSEFSSYFIAPTKCISKKAFPNSQTGARPIKEPLL